MTRTLLLLGNKIEDSKHLTCDSVHCRLCVLGELVMSLLDCLVVHVQVPDAGVPGHAAQAAEELLLDGLEHAGLLVGEAAEHEVQVDAEDVELAHTEQGAGHALAQAHQVVVHSQLAQLHTLRRAVRTRPRTQRLPCTNTKNFI